MRYNTLGRSGLKVSAIALGTFTFGGRGPFAMVGTQGVPEARALIDAALDHGVNLIDTANMYSTGLSEEIVGEALEGRRDRVLISSISGEPLYLWQYGISDGKWRVVHETNILGKVIKE